jgi:hypothetical protein
MPTHEKDEELRFVKEVWDKNKVWDEKNKCWSMGTFFFQEVAAPEIAAFATKIAFQEGRLQGLKEMDEAYRTEPSWKPPTVLKLRQEYLQSTK